MGKMPSKFNRNDRELLGYLLQQFVLYPDLTVWENLNFAASLYGVSSHREKRLQALLEFVELDRSKKKLAKNLSGGMRRRLSLASTLVHEPEILYLDEPYSCIDPLLRRKFWDYFKELQNEDRTLFITTQYVGEAAYCDLVGIMMSGKLLMVDTPSALRRKAYGGDLIQLRTVYPISRDQAKIIENNLNQIQASIIKTDNNNMQIRVQDAASAMPILINYAKLKR